MVNEEADYNAAVVFIWLQSKLIDLWLNNLANNGERSIYYDLVSSLPNNLTSPKNYFADDTTQL